MAQLTYFESPGDDPAPTKTWTPAPDDVHTLRHGYNIADLNRLTRSAIRHVNGMLEDYRTRYEVAWPAIAEALYAAPPDEPPTPLDLINAGREALQRHVTTEMHHHGRRRGADGQTEEMPRYAAYWDWLIWRPDPSRVVESVAVWQIWAALPERHRRVLRPLTAGLAPAEAARALDMPLGSYRQALRGARRAFRALWHEGESLPGQWGYATRTAEPTYRLAMRGYRRRPRAALPQPKCGRASTYQLGCRCEACTEASRRQSAGRRRRRGMAERRYLTDADRARIVELTLAGASMAEIEAETGWSKPTINNTRSRARSLGQLPPVATGRWAARD